MHLKIIIMLCVLKNFFETLKYYTKPVSCSQDQKGTAGKQKALSSVSFSITPIHILETIYVYVHIYCFLL